LAVELHIHSYYSSDSLVSPAEIVARARSAGLSSIAITDHDTVRSLPEAVSAASSAGERAIEVVPAVELSGSWPHTGEPIHIVGLLIDPACRELVSFMARARGIDRRNFEAVIAALVERGLKTSVDDVRRSFAEEHPGVPWDEPRYSYLYRYLVREGASKDERSARRILQRVIASLYQVIEAYLPCAEAIAAAKAAGGIAVLAHPGSYSFAQTGAKKALKEMISDGLGGLEALHRAHSIEDRARFAALARQMGLLISGGSDSHDPANDPVFGTLGVPDAVLDEMKRRLGRA
jgi:hypothetical protein